MRSFLFVVLMTLLPTFAAAQEGEKPVVVQHTESAQVPTSCPSTETLTMRRDASLEIAERGYEEARAVVEDYDLQVYQSCQCHQSQWDGGERLYVRRLLQRVEALSAEPRSPFEGSIAERRGSFSDELIRIHRTTPRPECQFPPKRSWVTGEVDNPDAAIATSNGT